MARPAAVVAAGVGLEAAHAKRDKKENAAA